MALLGLFLSGCDSGNVGPEIRAASVEVAPASSLLVSVGETVALTARAFDEGGTALAGASLSWSSSDPDVATVTATGVVEAVHDGEATITATAGTATGSAVVTVSQVPARLAFHRVPEIGLLNEEFWTTVEIQDAGGSKVLYGFDTVTVSLAAGPGGAVLAGEMVLPASLGWATFLLTPETAGTGFVLNAEAPGLAGAESDPFDVWEHPVRLDSLVLDRDTLAIGGAAGIYRVWLTNIGAPVPSGLVQTYIEQEGVSYAAGGRVARCGDGPSGQIPTGTCSFGFTLNTQADGGLVPGPAEAVFQVSGGGTNPFLYEVRFALTLIEFVPPAAPDVTLGAVTMDSYTLVLGGPNVAYRVQIESGEPDPVPAVTVQGHVEQGSASRAAGGSQVNCGSEGGTVPVGGCEHGFSAVANNALGGTGTLVAGPATLRLQLYTVIDGVGVDLDEVLVGITLRN